MGHGSTLHLKTGNAAGANCDMKIVLYAAGGFAFLNGAIYGNATAVSSTIRCV